MTWSPALTDQHHPTHADVTGCDYKDTNLVCAADGEDWPCTKILEHRETMRLVDRVSETLKAKIEGDMDRMPEKGMFVCKDIVSLLELVRSHAMD